MQNTNVLVGQKSWITNLQLMSSCQAHEADSVGMVTSWQQECLKYKLNKGCLILYSCS